MCIVAQTQGHSHVHYEQFVIHLTFFCLLHSLKASNIQSTMIFLVL